MSQKLSQLNVIAAALALANSLTAADLSAPRPPNSPKIAPASDEGQLAIKQFTAPPGFVVELFAAEPLLAHPVAFALDEHNRVYVSESFRVGEQVTDIRRHMSWLNEELASTNTAQFRQLIEKYLDPSFMTAETERIRLLEDTNGDGKADRSTVFADGFNDLTSGIASGVLARKGDVYFTCIPDLWRLRDTNNDGKADIREILHHGYAVRFGFYGHDLHGLRIGPDGKLYFSIGDRGFNVQTPDGRHVAAPESGAVLRCNLDGSGLELFATGLRNPQELAFDRYGDLFTGDNNSDGGDAARLVHVVEGGDSGWRIGWQFINRPVARGPWNAENMWHPRADQQPAFLVPPVANFGNGPSGLTCHPGTGLPPELKHHFFMADFKGVNSLSLVHSFALNPKGASFEMVNRKPFLSGILVTDVDFGTDGSLYVSDWVEGWGKTGKGRLYRVFHPQFRADALARQTMKHLADGFESRGAFELIELLGFPDQRVRQEAQFELAARGIGSMSLLARLAQDEQAEQLPRLHAIWALGQIHANAGGDDILESAIKPLVVLARDYDPEVRAQTAKVLGNARYRPAERALTQLLAKTESSRARFFAAMALGKIGGRGAAPAILEMLRDNADEDPYLRHAGVMALYWLNDSRTLDRAATDPSSAVRLAALLALRRLHHSGIARFLHDQDPRLVVEAARAINDLPIEDALSPLANLIDRPIQSEPLLRRVINANYRLGFPGSAAALVRLAMDGATPEPGQLEALQALEQWSEPPGRDAVTGLWRPLAERDATAVADALRPMVTQLISGSSPQVQAAATRLAGTYQLREASALLAELAQSEQTASRVRVEALRALGSWDDPALAGILKTAGESQDEAVRKEVNALMARMDPAEAVQRLEGRLTSGSVGEQQAALVTLGRIERDDADQLIDAQLRKLLADELNPALRLDLLEAAAQRKSPEVTAKLNEYEASRPATDIGKFIECLSGGNAAQGRRVFFERVEASCVRCHKVGGEGGEAGPALDKAGMNRTREYLLESIVAPNKVITPGFETVTVFLKNDDVHSGIVKLETTEHLVLVSADEGEVAVSKADIDVRKTGLSGMPEGLAELVTKRDLRDLVEFLTNLEPEAGD